MQNKLILWLLLLPLLLSICGITQYSRNYDSYNFFQKTMTERMDLAADVKADPETLVRFENGTTILGSDYILKLDSQFAKYETEISLINFQHTISVTAIVMAILSLILAGFTLLLCINGAYAARQSRDLLLSVFKFCRKILPYILTAQMLLAALSFLCLSSYEAIWLANKFVVNQDRFYLLLLIGFTLLAMTGYILWGLLKLRQSFVIFQGEPIQTIGQLVNRVEAPNLWYWIDSLAEKAQTSVPDNIIVGLTECFYVTSHRVCLNKKQIIEGRTLYFPLSYIELLNRDEVGSVIVYKLAFFKGDNRRLDLDFSPIYSGINQSIQMVEKNIKHPYHRIILAPSLYIGRYFLEKFNSPINYWQSIRENEAAQVNESLNYPTAIENTLQTISAINDATNHHLKAFYCGVLTTDDLLPIIIESLRNEERADIQNYLEQTSIQPSDTHLLTVDYHQKRDEYYANLDALFLDAKTLSMAITRALSAAIKDNQGQK